MKYTDIKNAFAASFPYFDPNTIQYTFSEEYDDSKDITEIRIVDTLNKNRVIIDFDIQGNASDPNAEVAKEQVTRIIHAVLDRGDINMPFLTALTQISSEGAEKALDSGGLISMRSGNTMAVFNDVSEKITKLTIDDSGDVRVGGVVGAIAEQGAKTLKETLRNLSSTVIRKLGKEITKGLGKKPPALDLDGFEIDSVVEDSSDEVFNSLSNSQQSIDETLRQESDLAVGPKLSEITNEVLSRLGNTSEDSVSAEELEELINRLEKDSIIVRSAKVPRIGNITGVIQLTTETKEGTTTNTEPLFDTGSSEDSSSGSLPLERIRRLVDGKDKEEDDLTELEKQVFSTLEKALPAYAAIEKEQRKEDRHYKGPEEPEGPE